MSTTPTGPSHRSPAGGPADDSADAPRGAGRARPGASPGSAPTRVVLLAVVLDLVSVIAFAAGGRATHAADSPLVAVGGIAWPFLAGLAVAWVLLRAWRRPIAPWPVGIGAWVLTWGVGMALRAVTGAGLAVPFLVVSALFLGATLVGWRLVARLVVHVRSRPRRRAR